MTDDDLLLAALEDKEAEYIPLRVSSGILLHIGSGIYNSVASAIKELISNAYDADATRITIMTNYPVFGRITVVDNGSGMDEVTFTKAMGSIGSSLKREITPQGVTPIYKRPIIGHLGIGLMALSQICEEAVIESQARGSDMRFVAKLNFKAIRDKRDEQILVSKLEILSSRLEKVEITSKEKQELRRLESDLQALAELSVARVADDIARRGNRKLPGGEQLGYCLIYPRLPAMPGGEGTKITLYPLDHAVTNAFQDINRSLDALPKRLIPEEYQFSVVTPEAGSRKPHNPENEIALWQERRDRINTYSWRELCERLRLGKLSYQVLPQYHQFLLELGVMSPVRYFPDGPVIVKSVLRDERRRIEEFEFSLIVDNRELFKPILLPSAKIGRKDPAELHEGLDYFVETFQHSSQVGESEMRFKGYIFWQSSQIQPSTVRGIEIYIRNVGIGLHDQTLLNFATVNPTSRAGQISGEIYVEHGLVLQRDFV